MEKVKKLHRPQHIQIINQNLQNKMMNAKDKHYINIVKYAGNDTKNVFKFKSHYLEERYQNTSR